MNEYGNLKQRTQQKYCGRLMRNTLTLAEILQREARSEAVFE
jgi:hypothetical protein